MSFFKTIKQISIVFLLSLSSATFAAPYAFTFSDTIKQTDGPFIAGEAFVITVVSDNGGTTNLSQTWTSADVVSITFSMNNAPNTITTVFSPVSFDASTGSFSTDGTGSLTSVPSFWATMVSAATVLSSNDPGGSADIGWYIYGVNRVYYNTISNFSAGMTNVANNIVPAFWTVSVPAPPVPPAPTFEKAFSPTSIALGETSTLTFTVTNPNNIGLTGLNFTDSYPVDMSNTNALVVGGTCGSITHSAVADGNTFNLTGATIGANTTCTVTVDVTSTSVGEKVNTATDIGSTESGAGTDDAEATLTVTAPPAPTFEKAFSPASIALGETSTLIFTITNSNAVGLTGLNFADIYPTGLVNTNPLVVGGTCGSITHSAVVDGNSFNLTGATIGANTTCTVTVDVTATTTGALVNTAMNIGSTESGAGTDDAAATLTVTTPPPVAPAAPVPTISAWGLGVLASLLGLVGFVRHRKA